ncbi:hypothetical protein [Undibacterium sp.]|uniref:hypothetical protein n=1 Tax=Undibacterium sp. TaxID=1914977 RepID=UPI002731A23E|nr:hypothetical protein [Undibacterium sp.]MDP1977928.1 hypothetical protein [Undibacterium sp.]
MNIPYKKISVLMLSLAMVGSALADGNRDAGLWGRFNGGNPQLKDENVRKDDKQRERQINKQGEKSSLLERCSDARRIGERACGAAENAQKPNRLSPEERRALRRQIQDVGHELYKPLR